MNLDPALQARTLSPALVVCLETVRHNIGTVLGMAGNDPGRWRPHLKTTKLPVVWRELLAHGVRQVKCATIREAALFLAVGEGFRDRGGAAEGPIDVLLAYPLVGPALERLGELARRTPWARISVLVECEEAVASVPPGVDIFVDVNPGMDRTGVPASEGESILRTARAAGSRFRGFHFYDGHLHDHPLPERHLAAAPLYARLLELRESCLEQGFRVEELITSGTPSFPCALGFEGFRSLEGTLHRISPGTVVFHDQRSAEDLPGIDLRSAARLMTRVVSHPRPGRVTCDAGSKSIAAEAGDPCARVVDHPDWVADAPSEEHLPLEIKSGDPPSRGDILWLVPRHVCPTVNLAERAWILDGDHGAVMVPVSGRGHELCVDEDFATG